MRDVLQDWRSDLDPAWQPVLAGVEPDFAAIDPSLELAAWEPVFPVRRGRRLLGGPAGGHMLHAFDGIAPAQVRCVVLGQDPYPDPTFSTGRAFEAGNVAEWRELEKMFSVSVRCFLQLIAAARTGNGDYARTTRDWLHLLADIEAGRLAFESAATLADRWVGQGVLLLNSSLTITRFQVAGDPHQVRGHLPLWRPVIRAVLQHLAARGAPVCFLAFGEQAAAVLAEAAVREGDGIACILRDHPARGDAVLAMANPFVLTNRHLARHGAGEIRW